MTGLLFGLSALLFEKFLEGGLACIGLSAALMSVKQISIGVYVLSVHLGVFNPLWPTDPV